MVLLLAVHEDRCWVISNLHRVRGGAYWVRPRDGRLRPARAADSPKHGVYALASQIPFPDEE